jgi:hypothetical protein
MTLLFLVTAISIVAVIINHPVMLLASGSKADTTKTTAYDTTPPVVTITNPPYSPYSPIMHANQIFAINGTAFDTASGIKKVEAFIHGFPFKGTYLNKLAITSISHNWSKWSFPLVINTTGTYRILIKATDNAGNQNFAEKLINVPFLASTTRQGIGESAEDSKDRIAIIIPTFTKAAYREHAFYTFYYKYKFPPSGVHIKSDLDMLTTPVIDLDVNATDSTLTNLTALIPTAPEDRNTWKPLTNQLVKNAPNAIITFLRDEDVNDGHIFSSNGSNAYNVLILLHDEYVTQKEFDNLKHFVINGGTIVFLDANVFMAEVSYDSAKQTATLVKGHYWKFDGKSAEPSVPQRWYNETKEWVGSDFLDNDISTKITFANNPFNYTHFEEQFVNNPNDRILVDYSVKFPNNYTDFEDGFNRNNTKVATYELNYGQGKIIMIGLYAERLLQNEAFLKFFDNEILKRALR